MKICLPRQVFILPTDSIAALFIEMDTFDEEEKGVIFNSFNKFSSSLKRIVLHFNLFSRVYEYSVCSFHKLLSYVKKARKEKQLTPAHLSKSHGILPVTVSYLKTCKSPVTMSQQYAIKLCAYTKCQEFCMKHWKDKQTLDLFPLNF